MKAKKEFYHFGNDRRFNDHYTISLMTGEPMPRKWQAFFDMTPEEKARWDASLKLDEEYRIAEAQGFPNGIPGGKTRGDMLHYLTQQEEAHKRNMQERSFLGQSFIPRKTEMQRHNDIMTNDTLVYGQSNAQPSFTFNRKLNTELPYIGQNNLLQMNIGIKKEPAFDLKQAIQNLSDRLRARWNANTTNFNQDRFLQERVTSSLPNTAGEVLPLSYKQPYIDLHSTHTAETTDIPLEVWENNIENKLKSGELVIYDNGFGLSEIITEEEAEARQSSGLKLLGEIETGESFGVSPVNALMADAAYDPKYFDEMRAAVLSDSTANRLRAEYPKSYDFLTSLIEEYGMDLVTKLPFPPHVRAAIVVSVYAKTLLGIAITVKDRRDTEITRLKQLRPQPYSHEEAVYIANAQVEGWLLEAIGEEIIKDTMNEIMVEMKIPTQAQHYIIATWETFINDQKRKYQSKII